MTIHADFFETLDSRPPSEFEGLHPPQMYFLVDKPFRFENPIQFKELSEADYDQIPILNQVRYLAQKIAKEGEIKLTSKGFLPVKLVAEVYHQGFIKEEDIENGITKLYNETSANSIHLTHILAQITGFTRKYKGSIRLTRDGKNALKNKRDMFMMILDAFAHKFNWAYFDGFEDNSIGQFGWYFTLLLLRKYGEQPRESDFYAEKYFKAFPHLLENTGHSKEYAYNCYTVRTFSRFLDYFGIINFEPHIYSISDGDVSKTPLFDKLVQFNPDGY